MKIINASFFINKDKIEIFLADITPLIESSRIEVGCLDYNLYESFEEPGHFIMIEHWENQEAINEHNKNLLLLNLLKNIPSYSDKRPNITVSSTDE
jgi:quinol monooxygenase YgiN